MKTDLRQFLKEYESKLDPIDLNNSAWDIFQYSSSTEDLEYALSLSERSMGSQKNNPTFMDTYANLLYKVGRKQEALQWEEKALQIEIEKARKESRKPGKEYAETLDKIKY